jgi:hypothetical protein
LPIE